MEFSGNTNKLQAVGYRSPGASVPEPTDNPFDFQALIEAQSARAPHTIAVIDGSARITYQELNRRANQLAYHLRSRGILPGALVGLCVSRSIDMVVGILGILKSGGAYVPLDPSYPKDRLAFVLDDARVQILVTQAELRQTLPAGEAQIVCLDDDASMLAQQAVSKPDLAAAPDNLAYVMYTSGSTGRPKGVMITRGNLTHFVRNACAALPVTYHDIYLHTASIGYALSVRQLMIPLCYGAAIVIATAEQARDPLLLFALIQRERISLMDVVPSFWRACVQALAALSANERAKLLSNHLRRIVSIGEPLLPDLAHKWRVDFKHPAELVNIFGQTETTGVVATFPIPANEALPPGIVSIGKPIPATHLYIVDANLESVPPGTPGELCVSSPSLALGYLNQPQLTAEKFIANPFGDGASPRLYRTGDLACVRADGNIDFIGRGDYQVKIRGQRLELGEVEAVLSEHPQVQAGVVMARGENIDDKYLAAYVVLKRNAVITQDDLREFLREKLPTYMIPSFFVFLDALPLTPNGKVNRLALPDPAFNADQSVQASVSPLSLTRAARWNAPSLVNPATAYIAPRTELEQKLATLWQELLRVARVGVQDNFFDLGGHSLLAVRLFARIDQMFGVRLPITVLFQSPTVEALAELIEHRNEKQISWSPVVPIRTAGTQPPFFGIHGQDGGVLFWRDVVMFLPDDQPFYGVQAQGVDGIQPALSRIVDMATRYIAEIKKVQPHGPYYLGGFSMGGEIAFEMARQLTAQGELVGLLVLFDTPNPDRAIRVPVAGGQALETIESESTMSLSKMWMRKLIGHWRRLMQRNRQDRWTYIVDQVQLRYRRAKMYLRVLRYRFILQPLPDALLLEYLREGHTKALQSHIPGKYTGKVTLFRASETLKANPVDSPMGWRPLALGGLEVHYFDSTHRLVDREYSAEDVAKKLTECLLKARGN